MCGSALHQLISAGGGRDKLQHLATISTALTAADTTARAEEGPLDAPQTTDRSQDGPEEHSPETADRPQTALAILAASTTHPTPLLHLMTQSLARGGEGEEEEEVEQPARSRSSLALTLQWGRETQKEEGSPHRRDSLSLLHTVAGDLGHTATDTAVDTTPVDTAPTPTTPLPYTHVDLSKYTWRGGLAMTINTYRSMSGPGGGMEGAECKCLDSVVELLHTQEDLHGEDVLQLTDTSLGVLTEACGNSAEFRHLNLIRQAQAEEIQEKHRPDDVYLANLSLLADCADGGRAAPSLVHFIEEARSATSASTGPEALQILVDTAARPVPHLSALLSAYGQASPQSLPTESTPQCGMSRGPSSVMPAAAPYEGLSDMPEERLAASIASVGTALSVASEAAPLAPLPTELASTEQQRAVQVTFPTETELEQSDGTYTEGEQSSASWSSQSLFCDEATYGDYDDTDVAPYTLLVLAACHVLAIREDTKSISRIQTLYRCKRERGANRTSAAVLIQSLWRGAKVRRNDSKLREVRMFGTGALLVIAAVSCTTTAQRAISHRKRVATSATAAAVAAVLLSGPFSRRKRTFRAGHIRNVKDLKKSTPSPTRTPAAPSPTPGNAQQRAWSAEPADAHKLLQQIPTFGGVRGVAVTPSPARGKMSSPLERERVEYQTRRAHTPAGGGAAAVTEQRAARIAAPVHAGEGVARPTRAFSASVARPKRRPPPPYAAFLDTLLMAVGRRPPPAPRSLASISSLRSRKRLPEQTELVGVPGAAV